MNQTVKKNIVSRHTLGVRGHYSMPKRLLQTAADLNLQITQRGHGKYRFEVTAINGDFDRLCPPFVKDHQGKNGNFSKEGLLGLLHFVHQPIGSALKNLVEEDFASDKSLREEWLDAADLYLPLNLPESILGVDLPQKIAGQSIRKALIRHVPDINLGIAAPGKYARDVLLDKSMQEKRTFSERRATHQALRFITTGNTIIPVIEGYAHLEEDHNECHQVSENAMREAHNWAHLGEIGETGSVQVTVPGTSYDPDRGFVFRVHPEFKKDDLFGQNRKSLRDFTLRTLSEIKGETLTIDALDDDIVLDGAGMQAFTEAMHEFYQSNQGVDVLAEARIEDLAMRRLKNVSGRKKELQKSKAAQLLLDAQPERDATEQIKNSLLCSSMLTAIVGGETMGKAWKYSHPTKLTDSPIEGTLEEMAIFCTALEALGTQENVTALDMEAFVHEFFPERAFMQKFVGAMQTSLDKIEQEKRLPQDIRDALPDMHQHLQDMQHVLHSAGITNLELSDRFVSEEHEQLLSALQTYIGRSENMRDMFNRKTRETYKGSVEPVFEFFIESFESIKSAPIPLVMCMSMMAGSYYYNNKDKPETVDAPSGMVAIETSQSDHLIGANPFDIDFTDSEMETETSFVLEDSLPPVPEGYSDKSHMDFGIREDGTIGWYKHLVGGKVVQFSNGLINGKVNLTFDRPPLNIFNVNHDFGVRPEPESRFFQAAEAKIQPTTDVMLNFNIAQNISHAGYWTYTLMVGAMFGFLALRHLGMFFGPMADLGYGMAMAGPRTGVGALDKIMGNPRKAKRLMKMFEEMKTKGFTNLTRADHIKNMQTMSELVTENTLDVALAKNDLLLNHIRKSAGIEGTLFTQALNDNRQSLARAENKLAHAKPLIAAEIRHTGHSEIFQALNNTDPSRKERTQFNRHAWHMEGALARKERRTTKIVELKRIAANQNERPGIFSLMGSMTGLGWSHVVDGLVVGSKSIQNGISYTPKSVKIGAAASLVLPVGAAITIDHITSGQAANIVGQDWASIINSLSDTAGAATGIVIPGTTFMGYNYVEDVLLVHVGGAVGFVTIGYVGGKIAYGQVARPTSYIASEYLKAITGIDTQEGLYKASHWAARQYNWLKDDVWANGISRPLAQKTQKTLFSAQEEKPKPILRILDRQALIEAGLGELVCTFNEATDCAQCPLRTDCEQTMEMHM